MNIVLHIERMVIDETLLGGERAGNVQKEIERELTQRLAHLGAVDPLPRIGAVLSLPPWERPNATPARGGLGGHIAAAVARRLGVGAEVRAVGADRENGRPYG